MDNQFTTTLTETDAGRAAEKITEIVENIGKVIIGKEPVVRLVILAMLSEGHVLIEDVPGVGKTSLASAVSRSIDCGFQRIQFTPDLMPSDITGFSIYNQKSGEFEFRKGAVMSNLILADEINRASAKTQASLLEAMEEKQVTVDSNTYRLEEPFMVLATQNPIESYGTYPLPDAQLDRFMMKVSIGYPSFEQEVDVLYARGSRGPGLDPVASTDDILELRRMAEQVRVERVLGRYIVQIITAIRNHPDVLLGSSPRGGIALFRASRAYALMQGRNYVIPDDITYLAPFILGHRVTLTNESRLQQRTTAGLIQDVLNQIEIVLDREEEKAGQPEAKRSIFDRRRGAGEAEPGGRSAGRGIGR